MIDLDAEIELLRQREWKLRAEQQTVLDHKDTLLREALEALNTRCGTNADERGPSGIITKIKTELGESK